MPPYRADRTIDRRMYAVLRFDAILCAGIAFAYILGAIAIRIAEFVPFLRGNLEFISLVLTMVVALPYVFFSYSRTLRAQRFHSQIIAYFAFGSLMFNPFVISTGGRDELRSGHFFPIILGFIGATALMVSLFMRNPRYLGYVNDPLWLSRLSGNAPAAERYYVVATDLSWGKVRTYLEERLGFSESESRALKRAGAATVASVIDEAEAQSIAAELNSLGATAEVRTALDIKSAAPVLKQA